MAVGVQVARGAGSRGWEGCRVSGSGMGGRGQVPWTGSRRWDQKIGGGKVSGMQVVGRTDSKREDSEGKGAQSLAPCPPAIAFTTTAVVGEEFKMAPPTPQ